MTRISEKGIEKAARALCAAAWKAAKLAYETTIGPAKLAGAIRAAYEVDGVSPTSDPELAKYRAAAVSELVASAPAGDGWRDIASAPKDGTEIIAWSRYFSSPAPYRWNGKTWAASHEMSDVIEYQSDFGTTYKSDTLLTHWQPLPAAPKGKETK